MAVEGGVRHNTPLLRLLGTVGAWIAADWAMLVALSVVAFRADGPGAVGLVGAARVLPAAVFAPLVSVGADRLPRSIVLAASHAVMAAASAALAIVSATGTRLSVVLGVVAVGSMLSAAFRPCVNALMPQVVGAPAQLVAANAAYTTVEAAATTVGPLLSGLLVSTVRPSVTFLVLAALYAAAAAESLTIRTAYQPVRSRGRSGWRALLEPLRGFPVLAGRAGVRVVFWMIMAQTAMRGLLNVFVVVLAARVDGSIAGLFAALGAGGLIGAQIAVRIGGDAVAARRTGFGVLLWGLPVAAVGGWPVTGVVVAALVVIGLGNAVEDAFGYSLLNRLIPDDVAGRAWGAFHTVGEAAIAAGSLLAPVLIHLIGLRTTMAVCGGALVLLVVIVWPRLRSLDAASQVPAEALALLREVPAFRSLPPLAVERLARAAKPTQAGAGAVLIAEGEPGDRFYLIRSGTASVAQRGRPVRTLGPGESFGEISLLRGVPRTATVTSDVPMHLLVVGVDAFVAAVTGHRDTYRAADAAVTSMLAADESR